MSSVRARQDGRLFFDFRFRGLRCRELSALKDTPTNRKRMERALDVMNAQIEAGTFDYAKTFPGSRRASRFAVPSATPGAPRLVTAHIRTTAKDAPLFSDFAQTWFQEKQIEWRTGHRESMQSILDTHLLPRFGSVRLDAISRADILQFRSALVNARGGRPDPKRKSVPLAPATINRIVGVVCMIMTEAALRFGISDPFPAECCTWIGLHP